MNLSNGPVVVTIPPANGVVYSLLVVDVFGNVVPVTIPAGTPGTYAIVPRGFKGTLPKGLTKVTLPVPVTLWNFRADKYSATGVNTTAQADAFRRAVRMTPLAEYEADPSAGASEILPVVPTFFFSFKLAEDTAATVTPNLFLRTMQRAVANPTTLPFSTSDATLSAAFDADFAAAQQAARRGNPVPLARIDTAVRRAYAAIVANFVDTTGPTNWGHQDNFAEWGTDYLARASGTEYLQFGNNNAAAGYWFAFKDGSGRRLNGALRSYKLTFPANNIPDAKRFWSLTAYNPHAVELMANRLNKYVVARYTPGLVYNKDGSVTIYISAVKPAGVPTAKWLPVQRRQFEIYLRVYGPTGNTAPDATPPYTPPAITTLR